MPLDDHRIRAVDIDRPLATQEVSELYDRLLEVGRDDERFGGRQRRLRSVSASLTNLRSPNLPSTLQGESQTGVPEPQTR